MPDSQRNWDYRYCWIRDAYYTVQALNRLGALDVLEGYLEYLRNIVDNAAGGHIQPLYGVGGEAVLTEREAPALAGYRGMGPVRVGNQAYEQVQHDAYGQIILSNAQAFFDQRLFRMGGRRGFRGAGTGRRARLGNATTSPTRACGNCAPRAHVHTYSAAMCWAACDRLANAAAVLGLRRSRRLSGRSAPIRSARRIEAAAWRADTQPHVRDLRRRRSRRQPDPAARPALPRARRSALPRHAGRGRGRGCGAARTCCAMRPRTISACRETAFNVCTFWLIEALHATGRDRRCARAVRGDAVAPHPRRPAVRGHRSR